MTFFNNITSLADLKAAYKKLAFKHHPDMGGDAEVMKQVNAEYDEAFETLKKSHNAKQKEDRQTSEMAEDYRVIIEALLHMKGIEVELCGNWIWISGDTKPHKADLKALGMYWASKKKMWYWRADQFQSRSRRNTSMSDIRNKYGSTKFAMKERTVIGA